MSASEILNKRHPLTRQLEDKLLDETYNSKCASMVYEARQAAGLTQAELAKKIGTSQSAIARLEDADYRGRTVAMMVRIASALGLEYHHEFRKPKAPAAEVKRSVA